MSTSVRKKIETILRRASSQPSHNLRYVCRIEDKHMVRVFIDPSSSYERGWSVARPLTLDSLDELREFVDAMRQMVDDVEILDDKTETRLFAFTLPEQFQRTYA